MIIRKSKYTKGHRSSSRGSYRRNSHQRNGSYGSSINNKARIKGSPYQVLNKYLGLAKEALSSGDRIQAEYYFQHADHYSRIMIKNDMDLKIIKTEENQKNDNATLKNSSDSSDSNESTEPNQQAGQEYKEDTDNENDNSLESVGFLSGDLQKK